MRTSASPSPRYFDPVFVLVCQFLVKSRTVAIGLGDVCANSVRQMSGQDQSSGCWLAGWTACSTADWWWLDLCCNPMVLGDKSPHFYTVSNLGGRTDHRGFACTKPPSRAVFMKNIFCSKDIFFGYRENNTCF